MGGERCTVLRLRLMFKLAMSLTNRVLVTLGGWVTSIQIHTNINLIGEANGIVETA